MTLPDGRLLADWLTTYLEFNSEHEAPESLHLWTGICMISASARRQVFIELEYGRVYPNMFVIIVAESARVRKSTAMDIGREMLIDAIPDMRIMRDSMTSQGLIKSLNHVVNVVKDNKIVEEQRSDVAIFADEVANLFSYDKMRAAQLTIFLTRTYTCPGIYDHTTARDSTVRLYNMYPVLLGGTDPRNLKVIPEEAAGGLTGRLIWVIESQRRANNTGWLRDHRRNIQQRLLREYLIHDLRRISQIEGPMVVRSEAMDMYDVWYNELSKRDTHDPESDAFYQRCHTTALRLAIILSLAQREDRVVTDKHMLSAIQLIESQLPTVKRVLMWGGASQYEQHRAKLINFLQKSSGVATRRTVLSHMGMQADEFDRMTATLVQDGTLIIPTLKVKNEVVLKLNTTTNGVGPS